MSINVPAQQKTVQASGLVSLLDIGGEGRYPGALNLNPSRTRTLGPHRGMPIPCHLFGRAESIPLSDCSVLKIIMERTPLRHAAVDEMLRVLRPEGSMVLRHTVTSTSNPHTEILRRLVGQGSLRRIRLGKQSLQEISACRTAFL